MVVVVGVYVVSGVDVGGRGRGDVGRCCWLWWRWCRVQM